MSKTDRWRKIFGYVGKQKSPVRVGEKYEDMTGTQAYRFEELMQPRRVDRRSDASTGPGKTTYGLAEASSCLNVSEEIMLQKAAFGSVILYVDAGISRGRWRRRAPDDGSLLSPVQTLISGFLALTSRSCSDIAKYGSINVSGLELRRPVDSSAVDLDCETMATMSAWADRNKIVLLAPLPVLAA